MKLTCLTIDATNCDGGACPALYQTDRGTLVIQGRRIAPAGGQGLNEDDPQEDLIEIPTDLVFRHFASSAESFKRHCSAPVHRLSSTLSTPSKARHSASNSSIRTRSRQSPVSSSRTSTATISPTSHPSSPGWTRSPRQPPRAGLGTACTPSHRRLRPTLDSRSSGATPTAPTLGSALASSLSRYSRSNAYVHSTRSTSGSSMTASSSSCTTSLAARSQESTGSIARCSVGNKLS
jgi:hypothetical protein